MAFLENEKFCIPQYGLERARLVTVANLDLLWVLWGQGPASLSNDRFAYLREKKFVCASVLRASVLVKKYGGWGGGGGEAGGRVFRVLHVNPPRSNVSLSGKVVL